MRIGTFVTAAIVAVMGTVALAQNVSFDFDKSADFSRFRTYAWVKGTILSDELNHGRIVSAVNGQLAMRGFSQVAPGAKPDVLVAYHATFDRDLQITGFSTGWGGYRFGGNRSGTARAEEILTGTLALDMVDAHSNAIVWRAIASKDVDVKANPEKREKNINRAVEKLFKTYPRK